MVEKRQCQKHDDPPEKEQPPRDIAMVVESDFILALKCLQRRDFLRRQGGIRTRGLRFFVVADVRCRHMYWINQENSATSGTMHIKTVSRTSFQGRTFAPREALQEEATPRRTRCVHLRERNGGSDRGNREWGD